MSGGALDHVVVDVFFELGRRRAQECFVDVEAPLRGANMQSEHAGGDEAVTVACQRREEVMGDKRETYSSYRSNGSAAIFVSSPGGDVATAIGDMYVCSSNTQSTTTPINRFSLSRTILLKTENIFFSSCQIKAIRNSCE